MGRWLLRLFTCLTLLPLLALCVMWVHSHWRSKVFEFDRHAARWEIISSDGRIKIDNVPQQRIEQQTYDLICQQILIEQAKVWQIEVEISKYLEAQYGSDDWKRLIEAQSRLIDAKTRQPPTLALTPLVSHTFRYALLAAAWLVFPLPGLIVEFWRWRTRRRWRLLNLCPSCGYDLRASEGTCPECGCLVNRV